MVDLALRSRHWIINEKGDIIIGEGRSEILENIEKTGSLNRTAKIMKMSYKGVWSKIKVTENYLKVRLVATDKTRGSSLTQEGKELLEKYHILKAKCLEADDKIFRRVFK
ncbi:MAG: LysR family transcriptional regulator [Deltaproteobacteria bacterium]|nr:LysR family transcriptional regulator [Deltaproteobacteria bacterium]